MNDLIATGTQWLLRGRNELHTVVIVKPHEVVSVARDHTWAGPITEFLKQFKSTPSNPQINR